MLRTRLAYRLAGAYFRHADIPPRVARRPGERIGLDYDHRSTGRGPGALDRLFQSSDRSHGFGYRPHRFGVLGEIHFDQIGDSAILDQVVERGAALEVLQPVDHRVAAVVAYHHDHLVAAEDRAVNVRVHHQIGAIAYENKYIGIGGRHLRPPAAGDLVPHARESELAIESSRRLHLPALHQLAGKPAGSRQHAVPRAGLAIHRADDVRVSGKPGIVWRRGSRDRFVPRGVELARPVRPRLRSAILGERRVELADALACIAYHRQCAV